MNQILLTCLLIQGGLFVRVFAQRDFVTDFRAITTVPIAVLSSIVLIGTLIGLYYYCRAMREARRARLMNDAMYQMGLWNEGNVASNLRNAHRPVFYDGYGFASNVYKY